MHQPQDQAEGTSVSQPGVEPALVAPNGLEQILATFGDIYKYIRPDGSLDPRWQADFLERMALPFPLLLSWDQLEERQTDHLSQGDDSGFRGGLCPHSGARTAGEDQESRRMLCLPPAADGD